MYVYACMCVCVRVCVCVCVCAWERERKCVGVGLHAWGGIRRLIVTLLIHPAIALRSTYLRHVTAYFAGFADARDAPLLSRLVVRGGGTVFQHYFGQATHVLACPMAKTQWVFSALTVHHATVITNTIRMHTGAFDNCSSMAH